MKQLGAAMGLWCMNAEMKGFQTAQPPAVCHSWGTQRGSPQGQLCRVLMEKGTGSAGHSQELVLSLAMLLFTLWGLCH